MDTKTVAIVGLGLAGLKAAQDLEGQGVKVELFEGRERFGGRVQSCCQQGVIWERGGEFIDADNECFRQLASRLGVTLAPAYGDDCYAAPFSFRLGERRYSQKQFNRDGQPLFAAIGRDLATLRDHPFGDWADTLRGLSAEAYIKRLQLSPVFIEAFEALWEEEMGVATAASPAISLLELELEKITPDQRGIFEKGYAKYRVAGGASQFVAALAETVSNRRYLGQVLEKVSCTQQSVRLDFAAGSEIRQRAVDGVVLALPLPCLARLDLSKVGFDQNLQHFIQMMPTAYHEKAFVLASATPADAEEMVIDPDLGGSTWTCRTGRAPAREPCAITVFHEHGEIRGDEGMIGRIRKNYDGLQQASLSIVDRTDWKNDRLAGGSYSQFGGISELRESLELVRAKPPVNAAGNIALAGEWASPVAYVQSHMEGALLSGKRAASLLLKTLGRGCPS